MRTTAPVIDLKALYAQNPNRNRVILHSDANCFYAAVECLYSPDLRDKPVAVCGDPEARHGIVLTKNYIAKKYGIQTGEVLYKARQKCPELVMIPAHYDLYRKFSRKLCRLYESYTDKVESYGLDECWLDVSGRSMDIDGGTRLANEIRERVMDELGITVSVGVSSNKAFAKLGSDLKKPNATTVIPAVGFEEKVWPLPVNELLFVGPNTLRKFIKWNIYTIGNLANADTGWLASAMGKAGLMLQQFALGLDPTPVADSDEAIKEKSIGNSTTTPRDMETFEDVKCVLYLLAECVSGRLRRAGFRTRTISLGVRTKDLQWYGKQHTIQTPTNLTDEIVSTALELFVKNYQHFLPLRSIGVHCDNLVPEDTPIQIDLFGDNQKRERAERLERTIDDITYRFGKNAIHRGVVYSDRSFSQINRADDHVGPATKNVGK